MAPLFAYSLFRDLTQLFTEADDYNVKIEVGEGSEKETFKAHSVILRARSPYFKTALSSTWVKKVGDIIIFSKPNISPKVFRLILKYMYTGEFHLMENSVYDNPMEGDDSPMTIDDTLTEEETGYDTPNIWLDLLIAADELALLELVNYMEEYIITYERDWIQENLANIFATASKYENFTRLWKHFCEQSLAQQPDVLFNSSYFLSLKQQTLLEFIKRDDLKIEEIEIWNNLIEWACTQTPELNHDVLTLNDYDELRNRLKDFIPLIRFSDISKENYSSKIKPYEKILPDNLRNELKNFFESENGPLPKNLPLSRVPISRAAPDSRIINNKQLTLIESWIYSIDNDETNFNLLNNSYRLNFYLLLRGSRDGMTVKEFHSYCLYKGPTIVVINVKDTNQVIGGYNPDSWTKYGSSKDKSAFIFSLGKEKSFDNVILSRVEYDKNATDNNSSSLGFEDLRWFNGTYNKNNFKKKIMKNSYEKFVVEDYEVFRVAKCWE